MMMVRFALREWPKTILASIYTIFVLYLFAPILVMIAMSFKDAVFIGFPIRDLTLDWYKAAVRDQTFISALVYSLFIALCSTVFVTVIGTWTAILLSQKNVRARPILFALACLPAVVPGMISAISLRIFIKSMEVQPGTFAIIFGHTVHAVPFMFIMVLARLNSMPSSFVAAAQDLGADRFMAFFRVVLPYLAPSIAGGMIFSLLLSFDDFVRTFFLGGYTPTLPILIYSKVQAGMSPDISAMATIVLVVTLLIGLYAETLTRRNRGI